MCQFFSVLDGIYGAAMFRRLAASEHVDWVILDSNFMVRWGKEQTHRVIQSGVQLANSVSCAPVAGNVLCTRALGHRQLQRHDGEATARWNHVRTPA